MRFELPDELVSGVRDGGVVTLAQVLPMIPPSGRVVKAKLIMLNFGRALDGALKKSGVVRTIVGANDGHAVRILTDEEARVYNARKFDSYGRRQRRRHEYNQAVDISRLGAEERRRHLHTLNVQGRVVIASIMARREPKLAPAARNTPTIGQHHGNGAACA